MLAGRWGGDIQEGREGCQRQEELKYTPRAFKDPQVYQDMKAEMTLDKQEITEEN